MNKVKKLLFIFLVIFLLYGCNSAEGTLTINANKSATFGIRIITSKDFKDTEFLNNINNYKLRNIEVDKVTDSVNSIYTATKEYSNIDKVSSTDDVVIDITKYLDADFDERALFKVEKGFLNNKYYANFTIDNTKIDKFVSEDQTLQSVDEFIGIVQDIYNNSLNEHKGVKEETKYTSEKNELSIDKSVTYSITVSKDNVVTSLEAKSSQYAFTSKNDKVIFNDIVDTNVEVIRKDNKTDTSNIRFIVNLPNKPLESNADTKSDDGTTLTWVYNKNRKNEIKFSFELINRNSYLIVFAVGAVLFIMFVILGYVMIISRDKKKRKIESEPIYTSGEETLQNTIEEPTVVNEEVNNVPVVEEPVITEEVNIPQVVETPVVVEKPAFEPVTEIPTEMEPIPSEEVIDNVINTELQNNNNVISEAPNVISIDDK